MDIDDIHKAIEAEELKAAELEQAKKQLTFDAHQGIANTITKIQTDAIKLQFSIRWRIRDSKRIESLCENIADICTNLRLELDHALYKENKQDYFDKLSKVYFPGNPDNENRNLKS